MRILLALDGSDSSTHARDLVRSLPWASDTTITLLTAYQVPAAWMTDAAMAGGWLVDAGEVIRRQATEALDALAAPLEGRGWAIDRRVIAGRAASVIRETADAVGADLIVIGSRGHGPIQTMLLGSVSAEVADQARQSVLVARSDSVTRMLVATDGFDAAAAIPGELGRWGVFGGMPAVALSVAPVSSPAFELLVSLYTLGSEPAARHRDELMAQYRGHAEAMARQLVEAGIAASAEASAGDAADRIVQIGRERACDLIVTGSRSLHGVDRLLLGSVARNVLQHAHASVLIVRPAPG